MLVRPARRDDLPDILRLAKLAGPGFTSLAVGEDALRARLEKSVKSFTGTAEVTPDHVYLLMLEIDGKVEGMSAVKAQIGMRDPFFNFRIMNVAQKSAVADRRFDMSVLVLVNDLTGATEVGSLFVTKAARGTGAGRLISQARYMLMAADQTRFSDQVISELRGHVDDKGYSPFWEAIGRKFFHMDFNEADHISAEQDNQFILDLMPSYPIYTALLPDEAQAVIGQTHPAGAGAKHFLEAEGFRYDGLVDIFDAGPSMTAPLKDIRTVRNSRLIEIEGAELPDDETVTTALISRDDIEDFRCVLTPMVFYGETALISHEAYKSLALPKGEKARI
ncbi:MAG: arginine N-succinyltransferase, partial [Maricaulaceae bacterium]